MTLQSCTVSIKLCLVTNDEIYTQLGCQLRWLTILFSHSIMHHSKNPIDPMPVVSSLQTASLDRGAASPDVNQLSRNKKRRRTLTGMFRKDGPFGSPSPGSSKRKSVSGSPKVSMLRNPPMSSKFHNKH